VKPVDIRVPLGWRVYVSVFGLVWLALCGSFAVGAFSRGSATGIVPVIMLAFGGTLVVRTLTARASSDGKTLKVRNVLSTRTLERAQVDSVRVGRPTGNPIALGQVITVLDRQGGFVTIDASMRTAFTARGKDALATQQAELERWIRGR